VLNIITLPVLAKENYLYLPSVGFCLLAVLFFEKAARAVTPRIAALLFACILLLFSMQTILRTIDYRVPIGYLLSAVRSMPPLSRQQVEDKHYFEGTKNWFTTCRNLGLLYLEKKDAANAEKWFLQALNYTPAYFDPRYGAECRLALGRLYLKQNRIKEAQSQLTAALGDTSRAHKAYNLLGVAAAKQNNVEAAEGFFNKALAVDPGYGSARVNLARLRRQQSAASDSQ
jgi:tetratricopeptide (TPR) repeat protein